MKTRCMAGGRCKKKQEPREEQQLAGRSEADLIAENAQLQAALQQAQQDVEILQEALSFFAKSRKKWKSARSFA